MCDKGYIDYKKFDSYTSKEIYFVSRLKNNAKFKEAIDLPITQCNKAQPLLPAGLTIIYDKKVRLSKESINFTKHFYRVVKIIDSTGKELTFVTHLMCYSSEEIAWLYKKRWDIVKML
ncbi:transposase [Cellulosilyticum ruminicola]|uniref:transposase n=1 Tax=Cellulosilyticum ruminicola TaxID=425254 RepID=UPI0038B7BE56